MQMQKYSSLATRALHEGGDLLGDNGETLGVSQLQKPLAVGILRDLHGPRNGLKQLYQFVEAVIGHPGDKITTVLGICARFDSFQNHLALRIAFHELGKCASLHFPALSAEVMVVARYELVEGQPAVGRVPQELHTLLRELMSPLDLVQRLLPLRDRDHQLVVHRRQHHRRLRYLQQEILQVAYSVVADLECPN